jgi:predicted transcriptional regulator
VWIEAETRPGQNAMASLTVRIKEETHRALQELAAETSEPMIEIIGKAIEQYRRNQFLDRVNEEYAALRRDPQAWSEELEERRAWDATLSDGLGDDEGGDGP